MKLAITFSLIYAVVYMIRLINQPVISNTESITICGSGVKPIDFMKTNTFDTSSAILTYRLEASIFDWEVSPGKTIKAWGYNQQVPGPQLKAQKGDRVRIYVKNNLPEATTIHWHGLRIPSTMDGTEEVQRPILPGEEFIYEFIVPDAGTFWYHPHTNETVQMERGLYGSFVVTDNTDPLVDVDRVMMVDDMKLNARNEFKTPAWFLPQWLERHNGREGETLIINGKETPEIKMAAGQTERWRFVNAASARYFRLQLGGRPFRLIGTDGGLIERPFFATEALISPGERVDILVGPFQESETLAIQTLPYDRGTGKSKPLDIGTISVGSRQASKTQFEDTLRSILPLISSDAIPNRSIKLFGKRNWKTGVDFTINDQMHLHDVVVKVNDLQVWEIHNPSMLDHPFHLHGFFFQVLEVNGVVPPFTAWKDTFSVPRNGRIKIAWLPDNRPGKWMYHCHILEHAVAGMMAHFEVVNDTSSNLHVTSRH